MSWLQDIANEELFSQFNDWGLPYKSGDFPRKLVSEKTVANFLIHGDIHDDSAILRGITESQFEIFLGQAKWQ